MGMILTWNHVATTVVWDNSGTGETDERGGDGSDESGRELHCERKVVVKRKIG